MIEIQLTQGQVTYVDDIDADLAELGWFADFVPSYAGGGAFRARRNTLTVNGRRSPVLLHRVILSRMLNLVLKSHELVDHIDRNPLNNVRENLRLASNAENTRNRTSGSKNSSGYKGVGWHKMANGWAAQICTNYKKMHLGVFDNPIDAAKAYDAAARALHGEFAVLNFPDG